MSKEVKWNEQFGTGGTLHCTCDVCGKAKDYKFSKKPDYRGAHERLKKQGWFCRKVVDTWYDFCSGDCFDKFYDDMATESEE